MSPSILDHNLFAPLGEAQVQDTGEMGSAQGCRTTSFRARTSQLGHSRPDWLRATISPRPLRPESGRVAASPRIVAKGHFRLIRPVLPVGSCRLRPERGPEAGRDGQKRVEVSRANDSSIRFRQCRRVATRHDKLAANYLVFIRPASIRLWLRVSESPRYAIDRARVSRAPGRRWRTGASGRRRPRLCRKPFASAVARR